MGIPQSSKGNRESDKGEEMKSYIEFKEIPTTTKTKRFEVISKTDGSKLGEIK